MCQGGTAAVIVSIAVKRHTQNRIELQVWVVQNNSAAETTVGSYGSVIVPGVLLMTGGVGSLVGEKSDPSQCPFRDSRNTRGWLRVSN